MSKQAPLLTMQTVRDDDDPGYRVGVAMDELVAWARDNGASENDLHERLWEAFDRYESETP